MATYRDNPYGAFNFLVELGGDQGSGDEGTIVGGFSDVSGLEMDIQYAEYRNGNERHNTVRKMPTTYTTTDVTLKRGVVGSEDLWAWLDEVRKGTIDARTVSITLMDEARDPVATWRLRNAQPLKWVGPTLAAKGGGESAMEELHLCHEGITYE